MAVVTLREKSKTLGDFYVPRFEIKIAGANLPLDVLRDVTQITYQDDIKNLDSFELTVNNWDPSVQAFKFVGSETAESLDEKNKDFNPLHRLFTPCRHHKVQVFMGYGSDLNQMLSGTFTTMEPNFSSGGLPTLTVRGLDILHKMRTEQHTYAWAGKTESQIAESFEKIPDPDNPGKKLPVLINKTTSRKEEPITYVAQNNQYDIDFLFERARRAGYVIYIKPEEKEGKKVLSPRGLYFGPSDADPPDKRRVTFELKWGLSLIDFKPTLTMANQVRNVTVRGWNRNTNKPISGKASLDDPKFKLNDDLYKFLEKCDEREEHVVDEPVFTPKQAEKRAEAILLSRIKEVVKVSCTCVGLPDLRAGQRVLIGNVGLHFSGDYFITDTTHTINDSGYITKFNARREQQQ